MIPILILNWNGLTDTLECIDSVLKLEEVNFRIVIADNGSTGNDQTQLEILFRNHPNIELVFFKENHGFTRAYNIMMEQVLVQEYVPPYIALLNNDTAVDKKWLTSLLKTAMSSGADIVASKMIQYNDHSKLDNVGHRMINTAEVVPIGHKEHPSAFNSVESNFGACAGACLYSTKMLNDIGVFDEYFKTGYEDAEIGVRAIVAGYNAVLAPDAVVYHKVSQSVSKVFNLDYLIKIQQNIYYTYFKIMPLGVILLSLPFLVIKYILVLLTHTFFYKKKHRIVHVKAIKKVWKDRDIIKNRRNLFKRNRRLRSNFSILRKQTFFLWFDIKRFVSYVFKKESSDFDKVMD